MEVSCPTVSINSVNKNNSFIRNGINVKSNSIRTVAEILTSKIIKNLTFRPHQQ